MKNTPTLKEAIDHVAKHGGHFEGRNGRVKYVGEVEAGEDGARVQVKMQKDLQTAEEIIEELCK
jgi:hypothetical protein